MPVTAGDRDETKERRRKEEGLRKRAGVWRRRSTTWRSGRVSERTIGVGKTKEQNIMAGAKKKTVARRESLRN